jgi:hypothetical protein
LICWTRVFSSLQVDSPFYGYISFGVRMIIDEIYNLWWEIFVSSCFVDSQIKTIFLLDPPMALTMGMFMGDFRFGWIYTSKFNPIDER